MRSPAALRRPGVVARDGDAFEGPRERLQALGPEALCDAELLALLLRTGCRGTDVVELSRSLLARCGGLRGVARAARGEMRSLPGMGPTKVYL